MTAAAVTRVAGAVTAAVVAATGPEPVIFRQAD
jgi:hypothetical protein